jgi:hypothetical protein
MPKVKADEIHTGDWIRMEGATGPRLVVRISLFKGVLLEFSLTEDRRSGKDYVSAFFSPDEEIDRVIEGPVTLWNREYA